MFNERLTVGTIAVVGDLGSVGVGGGGCERKCRGGGEESKDSGESGHCLVRAGGSRGGSSGDREASGSEL